MSYCFSPFWYRPTWITLKWLFCRVLLIISTPKDLKCAVISLYVRCLETKYWISNQTTTTILIISRFYIFRRKPNCLFLLLLLHILISDELVSIHPSSINVDRPSMSFSFYKNFRIRNHLVATLLVIEMADLNSRSETDMGMIDTQLHQ